MGQEIFGNILEFLLGEVREFFGQSRYGFREQIVDDVICLRVELMQEQLDLVPDSLFFIF